MTITLCLLKRCLHTQKDLVIVNGYQCRTQQLTHCDGQSSNHGRVRIVQTTTLHHVWRGVTVVGMHMVSKWNEMMLTSSCVYLVCAAVGYVTANRAQTLQLQFVVIVTNVSRTRVCHFSGTFVPLLESGTKVAPL